jgi:hypothetical protein
MSPFPCSLPSSHFFFLLSPPDQQLHWNFRAAFSFALSFARKYLFLAAFCSSFLYFIPISTQNVTFSVRAIFPGLPAQKYSQFVSNLYHSHFSLIINK